MLSEVNYINEKWTNEYHLADFMNTKTISFGDPTIQNGYQSGIGNKSIIDYAGFGSGYSELYTTRYNASYGGVYAWYISNYLSPNFISRRPTNVTARFPMFQGALLNSEGSTFTGIIFKTHDDSSTPGWLISGFRTWKGAGSYQVYWYYGSWWIYRTGTQSWIITTINTTNAAASDGAAALIDVKLIILPIPHSGDYAYNVKAQVLKNGADQTGVQSVIDFASDYYVEKIYYGQVHYLTSLSTDGFALYNYQVNMK